MNIKEKALEEKTKELKRKWMSWEYPSSSFDLELRKFVSDDNEICDVYVGCTMPNCNRRLLKLYDINQSNKHLPNILRFDITQCNKHLPAIRRFLEQNEDNHVHYLDSALRQIARESIEIEETIRWAKQLCKKTLMRAEKEKEKERQKQRREQKLKKVLTILDNLNDELQINV